VDVQVYYGPVSTENRILESHAETMTEMQPVEDGHHGYSHTLTCNATGRYGFTARAVPRGHEWKGIMPGFITWANGNQ
jgi:starch phosphorylase